MKHLTAKRRKTDQDYMEIARLEWEAGLYLKDGIVVMPGQNIEAMLLKAAKKSKNGVKYKEGAMVSDDYCPLSYKGTKIKVQQNGEIPNPELDKFYEANMHQALVKVGTSTCLRTRPIFHEWSLEFTLMIDEAVFDERTIMQMVKDAGAYVGLCENRPRMGRFEVQKI
jgi:hypothetical protein